MKNCADVFGWIQPRELVFLKEMSKGKVCLEIGSYQGKSTLAMAEGASKVYAVDTFCASGNGQTQMEDFTTLDIFKENIQGYSNIEYFVGESCVVVPKFQDDYYDFIFIDGMHGVAYVEMDIKVCWPKLKMEGIMAFHDYGWDGWRDGGPKKAIEKYFKDELKVEALAYVVKKRIEL